MNTNPDWQNLAHEMSDISELAFHAGWMDELEYRLWKVVHGGPRKYGQIEITDEQIRRLRDLSDRISGWVWFNDESGTEEFVERDRWLCLYEAWIERRSESEH